MNRRQIALKLVLEELGIPNAIATFDERLILQKAVYLAQQKGIPLGYHFYWYLRGPYSRDLTADAYSTAAEQPQGWCLDQANKAKLASLKMFFEPLLQRMDKVKTFELLASVLFAIRTGQAPAHDSGQITELMAKAGKNFTCEEIDGAIASLRQEGLLQAA